jgi:hypothetical protein
MQMRYGLTSLGTAILLDIGTDGAIRAHGFLKTRLVPGYENQMRAFLTFRYAVLAKGA